MGHNAEPNPFICRNHQEWTLVSNSVKAGGNFVVLDLNPATWYNLKVTAHNNAGLSVAEYEFATLTVTGGEDSYIIYIYGARCVDGCGGWLPRFRVGAP